MPMITAARGGATRRLPKYLDLIDAAAATPQERGHMTCVQYGQEDVCLLVAEVTDAQHAAAVASADVRAFPADLDTAVSGANRTAIVNALEALNVPAQWVANGQTFRMVLRRLNGIFMLLQNVHGRGFRFLQQALDNQISTLPANVRQSMQDAAAALNLNTSGITGATTLRVALATIGAQFDARPVRACKTLL